MTTASRQRSEPLGSTAVDPLIVAGALAVIFVLFWIAVSIPEYGSGIIASFVAYFVLERASRFFLTTPVARKRARRYLPFALLGAFANYWVTWHGSGSDSVAYHNAGVEVFEAVKAGEGLSLRGIPGTGTIDWLTGMTYLAFGRDSMVVHVVFGAVGIIGRLALANGMSRWFPVIREKTAVTFVLLLPSAWLWTAFHGKDSIVAFGLGLVVYGGARLTHGHRNGLGFVAMGMTPLMFIRPHFAAAVAPALLFSMIIRSRSETYEKKMARRSVVIRLAILAALLFLGLVAYSFAADARGATSQGLDALNDSLELTRSTDFGDGSQISAPNTATPGGFLWGAVTVLLRPWLWEASSPTMLLTSLEATVTGGWILVNIPFYLRRWRRFLLTPGGAFVVVNLVTGVMILGSLTNLGILARQRMQVLGILLVLVLLPLETRRADRRQRLLADVPVGPAEPADNQNRSRVVGVR